MSTAPAAVVGRIQKLLALSRDTANENEAALAGEKCRQLLAEHNLSLLQVEPRNIEAAEETVDVGVRMPAWQELAAFAAALATDCRVIVNTSRDKASRKVVGKELRFFGIPANAQAAAELFHYFTDEIERLCLNSPLRLRGRRFRNGYRGGAASRVRDEIKKLKSKALESQGPCTALVRVADAVAQRYEEENYKDLKPGRRVTADEKAFSFGYSDAEEIEIQPRRKLAAGGAR